MDTNFCPLPVADLLSPEPEPVRWVWEPFLPEGGLALLVAFMKVGKMTFAYALAAAVAQGRPFLGFPTKRGGEAWPTPRGPSRRSGTSSRSTAWPWSSSTPSPCSGLSLLLDRRQGGKGSERVLRALGRYAETPRELILELAGDTYRNVGAPEELSLEAVKTMVRAPLGEESLDLARLARKAGLSQKAARKALAALSGEVLRTGKGVKGSPHLYRRAGPNSTPSQPLPYS